MSAWDAALSALEDPWDAALRALCEADASSSLPPEWEQLRRQYEAHQNRTQRKYGRHAPQMAVLARDAGRVIW